MAVLGNLIPDKRVRTIAIVCFIAGVLILAAFITFELLKPKDPFSASLRDSQNFPLYYPARVPNGFQTDPASVYQQNQAIFVTLKDKPANTNIVISQQPLPKNFNAQQLFSHNPEPALITNLGTMYDLSYQSSQRFMIVTPNSLIFIVPTKVISTNIIQQIANNFTAAPK